MFISERIAHLLLQLQLMGPPLPRNIPS